MYDKKFNAIIEKTSCFMPLNRDEILYLLSFDEDSAETGTLMALADNMSRKHFARQGLLFGQVGINNSPCSKNCGFCFFGEKHNLIKIPKVLSENEILDKVSFMVNDGIKEIFMMTTADYSFSSFIETAEKAREIIPCESKFVANIDDFDADRAEILKETGFTGAYHVRRLREGVDTEIPADTREKTLAAIKDAGLELYYCVEPIGPEHTQEEIADEILRGIKYGVAVMAVMRRTPVSGTPLETLGKITELELAKICAVTRIACGNTIRAMGVHEPSKLSLVAGANQIYIEKACNPRDTAENTEQSRGFCTSAAKEFLLECGWQC